MNNFKLETPRNVSKNRDILEKKDIIDFDDKNYTFVDPIFEAWIKTKLNIYTVWYNTKRYKDEIDKNNHIY